MQYLLSEWEINGYQDSDFEAAVWDTEECAVKRVLIGTTRCAGPINYDGIVTGILPGEVLAAALAWLEDTYADALKVSDQYAIDFPNDIKVGQRVVLKDTHKNYKKVEEQVTCWKCNGTGTWVNSRNPVDVRPCFTCDGTGTVSKHVRAPKGNGSPWDVFEPGSAGVVEWAGTFNKIWSRGGYNKYNRATITVRVQMDDGRIMNCPLSKLALDKEPMSDIAIRDAARAYAKRCGFGKMLNPHHAWDSRNYVAEQLSKLPLDMPGIGW